MRSFSGLRWRYLFSTMMGLLISAGIAAFCAQEEEPTDEKMAQTMQGLESQVVACVQNRIHQLAVELELSEAQARKLRVLAKSLERSDYGWSHNNSFSNPMLSEKWQGHLLRVLDVDQVSKRAELDSRIDAKRKRAKQQLDVVSANLNALSELALSSLQHRVYLTNNQWMQISELLTSYLDDSLPEAQELELSDFYGAKQTELDAILLNSQRIFFDQPVPFEKLLEQGEWGDQWRGLNCQTCHNNS